ncbi:MAG: hypothetical protein VKI81_08575 [Synechococcaceae cyanobacterium]|nr:hypothetical protein [Synechococcaceae cyanobacterium]
MGTSHGSTGHWQSEGGGGTLTAPSEALGLSEEAGNTWDAMDAYFECITTCSLEDGECVTRCVEELREQG